MKVVSAQIRPYRLAFKRPLHTAAGQYTERQGALLLLGDGLGRVGRGDAAPLPGFSAETLGDTVSALETATAAPGPLLQAAIDAPADIADLLVGQVLPPSAAHALDQALLELLSQQQGLALWRLLCDTEAPRHAAIVVHALVDGPASAMEAVARGITALKVKVCASSEEYDDARLASIRDRCGPETLIRLDANGGWRDASETLRVLKRFSRHHIHSVEQPLPAHLLSEMAQLRDLSPVPIAVDESVRTPEDLAQVLAVGACHAVVIKPMLCGGLQAAVRMGNMAAAAGLAVSVTSTLESGVGRFGALHVAASIDADLWSCGLLSGDLLRQDLVAGPHAKDGLVSLPSDPGLGCGQLSPPETC